MLVYYYYTNLLVSGMGKPWFFKKENLIFWFLVFGFCFFVFKILKFRKILSIIKTSNILTMAVQESWKDEKILYFKLCMKQRYRNHYINIIYITFKRFWTILKITFKIQKSKLDFLVFLVFQKNQKKKKPKKTNFAIPD